MYYVDAIQDIFEILECDLKQIGIDYFRKYTEGKFRAHNAYIERGNINSFDGLNWMIIPKRLKIISYRKGIFVSTEDAYFEYIFYLKNEKI